jgi:hypothetical protein
VFDLATMPKGMITNGAIKKRSSIEPSGAWLVDANQARIAQMSALARALGRSLVLAIAKLLHNSDISVKTEISENWPLSRNICETK